MPASLAAFSMLLGMLVVLGIPPLMLMKMLVRRQALAPDHQRPVFQAGVISAGAALIFNVVVCAVARPVTTDAEAMWNSVSAIHIAALLLSWLSLWGCVALAVLVRHRRTTKRHDPSETSRGKMA